MSENRIWGSYQAAQPAPGSPPKTANLCNAAAECQKQHWPSHKDDCKRPNYIIRAQLNPDVDAMRWRLQAVITDPPVERTLSCPASATFHEFHLALQTAFGWATTHTYDFTILDSEYRTRGMEMPEADSLTDMINRAMGDEVDPNSTREYALRISDPKIDPMLAVDKMHDKQRKHPRTVEKSSHSTKIFSILDTAQAKEGTMVYTYDFGDRWEHLLTVVGRQPATSRFRCTEGTGHPVAEDVTQEGWAPLKVAYRAAQPNQKQRENMNWFQTQASNGDRQGLGGGREHVWDKDAVNAALSVRVTR